MDWPDYLRDQAAKCRQLAEQTDGPVIKNEMLELASVCEEVARTISQAGNWSRTRAAARPGPASGHPLLFVQKSTVRKPCALSAKRANDFANCRVHNSPDQKGNGGRL